MLNGSGQAPGGRDLREFLKRVFKLKTDITNLQRRASRLGTKSDNEETREACKGLIRSLHDECNQLKEKQGQLRQAEGEWDEDRRESYRRTCRELTAHMKAFKDVANFYKERLQQYPHLPNPARPPGSAASTAAEALLPQNASSERDAEAEPLQQQQQQQRLASQTEVEFLSAVIDERSEQITDILEDVSELNRMMNEMAQEVEQQGFQLDQFNDNLENVAADVEMGVGNLASATRYQQRSNRCCCYLMIGVFVFVAALVVTILKLI